MFRAVNAAGTSDEQSHGGFYSRQFWIKSDRMTSSLATSSIQTITSTSLEPSATAPAAMASESAVFLSSSASMPNGASVTEDPTATKTDSAKTGDGLGTKTLISVGVGLGVGLTLLLLGVAFLWYRYRRRKQKSAPKTSPMGYHNTEPWQHSQATSNAFFTPAMYEAEGVPKEHIAEAPGWSIQPQELSAGTPLVSSWQVGGPGRR